jgi:hypothetical protein
MRARRVTRADLDEMRKRVPAAPIRILVIRRIVDPRSDRLPLVLLPWTDEQNLQIAATWEAIRADGKSRRLVLHNGG